MPKGKKTEARFRVLAAAIAVMIAAVCLLTACQPTPETPPVVNRADGKLEAKMTETPASAAPTPYQVPPHWKESTEKDKLTIEIDADIKLPGVTKFPVVKVEPVVFSQQRVDELVNYFAAGKKLYRWPAVMTKADYEKDLIEAKKGQEVDGKFVVTEDSKAWVKELEEKIRNAPEKYDREYVDTKLTYDRDQDGKVDTESGENSLSVAVDNGISGSETIGVRNYVRDQGGSTYFSYNRSQGGMSESMRESYREELKEFPKDEYAKKGEEMAKAHDEFFDGIAPSKKEAYLAMAKKTMDDLQIKDMMLVSAEKYVFDDANNKPLKGGYYFEFMRQSGGIAGYRLTSWMTHKDEEPPQYTLPFMQEQVSISVSDAGVESIFWSGSVKAVETVSENVGLLPFDQIQERAKKQIFYKNSFRQGSSLEKLTVNVTSAELLTGYINVKDHPDQALLVPMWVFHTTEIMTFDGKAHRGNKLDYLFNAIDGGVIGMKPHSREG